MLRGWLRDWAFAHARLYASVENAVDYPPWAIVTFAPLAVPPDRVAVAIWTVAVMAAYAAMMPALARVARLTARDAALPVVLVLCWGAVRSQLMSTPLAFAAGMCAAALVDRPLVSGVLLAISAAKPQIAAPFWICALAFRQTAAAASAAALLIAEYAIYLWWADAWRVPVLAHWIEVLRQVYFRTAGGQMGGLTTLGSLFEPSPPGLHDALLLSWCLGSLMVVFAVARALFRTQSPRAPSLAIALGCLWSLSVFRHPAVNMILFAPAFFAIYEARDRVAPLVRRGALLLMQAALTFDIASRLEIDHFNRVVLACACAAVTWIARRELRAGSEARSSPVLWTSMGTSAD